jgi:hypothetical protein
MTAVLSDGEMPPIPFFSAMTFSPPPWGTPLQHLIKGREVIKEGHVTIPVTLNLIIPPTPPPLTIHKYDTQNNSLQH